MSVFGTGRAAFRRPSFGAKRVSDCLRSAARCGAGVGGERTHLDKCTIWHCSRENRRPCASPRHLAAPPRQWRAFAPQPARLLAGTTRRQRLVSPRPRSSPRFQRDLSTRHFEICSEHSQMLLQHIHLSESLILSRA